jgi:hypothetical protein
MNSKLSSADCIYCGARIASNDRYQAYHIYKEHPEKIRECFEKSGYPSVPSDIRKLMSKEQAYEIFLETMEAFDKAEKELT